MTNFIPIFPVSTVVYPNETINLHIFEPKYIQLINECFETNKVFGIPVIINNTIAEMGTTLKVNSIIKKYDDGKLDIITEGVDVFSILEIIHIIPNKLYSGAIVTYPENEKGLLTNKMKQIYKQVLELHKLLQVTKKFKREVEEMISYDIAHHICLSVEEEYNLLQLLKENQRLEFLKRHLLKMLQTMQQTEKLKEKIKLNGHFRELR